MRGIAYFEKIAHHFKSVLSFLGIAAAVEVILRVKMYELSFIENCGVVGVLSVVAIGSILFIRSSLKGKSSWGSIVIFGNCLSFIAYLFLRVMFSEEMNNFICTLFGFVGDNASGMVWFRSIFSYGYTLFQFVLGYFVSKFGIRFLGIFSILNGLLALLLTFCSAGTPDYLIFVLRALSGIVCSGTVMSVAYNVKRFDVIQSKFSTLFNFVCLFGFTFSLWAFQQFTSPITMISFQLMMSIVAVLFIVPGVIFIIDSFITKSKNDDTAQVVGYFDILSYLARNKRYMVLFIQSILLLGSVLPLREVFHSEIANGILAGPEMFKLFFEKFSVFNMVFMVSFLSSIGFLRSILMMSVLGSAGIGILLLHLFVFPLPILVVAIGFACLGFSYPGHAIVQSFAGEIEKNPNVSSTLIAVLNTGTMLLGGALIGQTVVPMLGLYNPTSIEHVANPGFNYAMLFVAIASILSLLLSIYSYYAFDEKNTNEK